MPLVYFSLPFEGLRRFMLALSNIYRLHFAPSVRLWLRPKFWMAGS